MEYQDYVRREKELYKYLLSFIDSQKEDDLQNLMSILDSQNNYLNHEELSSFLHLIIKLSNNHSRQKDFFKQIYQILDKIIPYIKQTFSNFDLFKMCQSNKLILLYFIDHQIVAIDEKITKYILSLNSKSFSHFFYPEMKKFLDKKKIELFERDLIEKDSNIFDAKRRKGENDSYICSLIQQDSIDEFISYLNQTNLSLFSKISHSIFETNSFLLKESDISLIEYAAFFGSLKIFQYLASNNGELNSPLWLYAIHGRNLDLIHFLENNNIEPPNNSFDECLIESIKCHHNEIAEYFKQKMTNKIETSEMILKSIFQNYNFEYFPNEFKDNNIIFYYLCQYEYSKIVELYLKQKTDDEKIKSDI